MKTAAIVNPRAGQGRCLRRWESMQPALREAFGPMKFCPTTAPGDATEFARSLLRQGYDHILSAGGDGTHYEVVNGWFDRDVAINPAARLTVLPMGTGSDLARTLGITRSAKGLRALASAGYIQADAGRLTCDATHGGTPHTCYFINMVRVGFGGAACRYVNEHSKAAGGFITYLRAIIRCLATYRPRPMEIVMDGHLRIDGPATDFSIANGCYDAGGILMAPHARLDSGTFDCYHIGPVGFFEALRSLPKLYAGRLSERRDIVKYLRGRQLEITSPERVEVEADGEFAGFLPATVALLPGALRLTTMRPGAVDKPSAPGAE